MFTVQFLIQFVVILLVVGLVLYAIGQAPIPDWIKRVANVVAILLFCLWLLQCIGIFHGHLLR